MALQILLNLDGGDFERSKCDGVLQAARTIEVNEYGTRATETNLVGGVLGGAGGTLEELRLNRRLLYLIRDTRRGAIAFVGRVTDPRS